MRTEARDRSNCSGGEMRELESEKNDNKGAKELLGCGEKPAGAAGGSKGGASECKGEGTI